MSQYFIGIDLGTTHSAVSYFENGKSKLFSISQMTEEGIVRESLLPSALYLEKAPALPWEEEGKPFLVGKGAVQKGANIPGKYIHSAKSWLSNPYVSRKEKILPLEADAKEKRFSPLECSAALLKHMKECWDAVHPDAPMEEQHITLTLPASFDEVARRLTLEAAKEAGLPKVVLIEEPQAAFYHWIESAQQELPVGDLILICDCGGGTTDFSLLRVEEGRRFERVAIGKHLLLGGDNMDEALAHFASQKMAHIPSWSQLRAKVRKVKEKILEGAGSQKLVLPGVGSSLVGGSQKCKLLADEVTSFLLDGFFALTSWDESLQIKRASGVKPMGLPYEAEPSLTKHLATFLNENKVEKKPQWVLFNGGALKPECFRKRLREAIDLWFSGQPIQELKNPSFDYAVSLGAAFFGEGFHNKRAHIRSATPRSFYLEVDRKWLTLIPRGVEAPYTFTVADTFYLQPNVPVRFTLASSSVRLEDAPGAWVNLHEKELQLLPSFETLLKFGKLREERVPVQLIAELSPLGLIELKLLSKESTHQWNLEFQTIGVQGNDLLQERLVGETHVSSFLEEHKKEINESFVSGQESLLKTFFKRLEEKLSLPKHEWSPTLLRLFFDELISLAPKRKLSKFWAEKFWNLIGFFLRPGFGAPLDDYRVQKLWRVILEDLNESAPQEIELQKWICYRRIAAGLSKGQQKQLSGLLLPKIYNLKKQKFEPIPSKQEYAFGEILRAIASFEKLDLSLKHRLGDALVERLEKGKGLVADYWAIGRLGGRHLMSATAAYVVAPQTCIQWIDRLMYSPYSDSNHLSFALLLLARKTQCSEIDLPIESSKKVEEFLTQHAEDLVPLLKGDQRLSESVSHRFFGEAFPSALTT
jgi:molecular chaperone DnaK (HSP70)